MFCEFHPYLLCSVVSGEKLKFKFLDFFSVMEQEILCGCSIICDLCGVLQLAVVGMVRILSFFTSACITSYNNAVLRSILVVEKSAATWMARRKGSLKLANDSNCSNKCVQTNQTVIPLEEWTLPCSCFFPLSHAMMIRNVDRQFVTSGTKKQFTNCKGVRQNKKTLDNKNALNSIPFIPMCMRRR